MNLNRRHVALASSVLCLGLSPATRAAETWRIIMPFAAGGATDVLARMIADKLREQTGHTVIVENIVGANGSIGTAAAARAPADGKTMLITSEAYATVNPLLFKATMRYEPSDLTPISLLGEQPAVLFTHAATGMRTLDDFVRKARASGVSYSSAGIGSTSHLATGYLASVVPGMKLTHVPFAGGAPAINAVIGGQVDAAFIIAGNVLPHVRAGKLVPIAVSSAKRLPQLPDVPTVAESGHAGFSAVGGVVLAVPAVTPPETRAALAKLVREAMLTAQIQNHLQANGFVILNSTAEEAQAWIARETRLWSTLIQERRILE
jgi:tripartite-type tricarboxylate transporter receptor subunit TctC